MRTDKEDQRALASRVASIVLAGGQGSRLFPLTQRRCKPSVCFGGRYRLIDIPISASLNSQIHDIFVITQFLATSLHQHLLETYAYFPASPSRIQLLAPEELPNQGKVWFKGTADAVRQNLKKFENSSADYFLVLSGDQLYNMDFFQILEFSRAQDADLVVAALPVEEKEARRMGLLKISASSQITDFIEKPSDPNVLKAYEIPETFYNPRAQKKPHYLGSMGIYVFKRETLFSLLGEKGDDFGRDLIPLQLKKGKTMAFLYDGYWEDIGTISSYYYANLALTKRHHCLDTYNEQFPIYTYAHNAPNPLITNTVIKDSIIGQGSIIDADAISGSVIGVRSKIGVGTTIADSIVIGNHVYSPQAHQSPPLPEVFGIGAHCRIQKTIIDEYAHIGDHVQLINKDRLEKYDGDGIYIRDGIIVVTSGISVPSGFIL